MPKRAPNKTLTGLSRQKEASYNRRMVSKLGRKLARQLQPAISAAMTDAYSAKLKGQPLKRVEDAHKKRIYQLLRPAWTECMDMFGRRIINSRAVKSINRLETKAVPRKKATNAQDNFNNFMQDYIDEYGAEKATSIAATTIKPFLDADLTNYEIAQELQDKISTLSAYRANLIARTEMHSASNYASYSAAKSLEVDERLVQVWSAVGDDRTRDEHASADGETVGMDENFNIGGEELAYPGDPAGSGWNTINCRCCVVHELK